MSNFPSVKAKEFIKASKKLGATYKIAIALQDQ